jgi:hypothetical protein
MNRTDICNMALSFISRQRIDSFDDGSEEAKHCKIYYEHTRKRLLKMYNWNFAQKMERLALRTDTVPGWDYVYGYPQQCLAVQFVFDENHAYSREMNRQEYRIITLSGNDKVIATNVDEAWVEYIQDVVNTETFSEEFIEALARMLAANLSAPLTGSTDLFNINMQLAQSAVSMAMQENVTESERKTQWPRKYSEARFR